MSDQGGMAPRVGIYSGKCSTLQLATRRTSSRIICPRRRIDDSVILVVFPASSVTLPHHERLELARSLPRCIPTVVTSVLLYL